MSPIFTTLAPCLFEAGAKLIDRLIPEPAQREQAKLALFQAEGQQALQEMQVSLSAILAEANSADPWTSRARPTFLHVIYGVILLSVIGSIIGIWGPAEVFQAAENLSKPLNAVPESLWWLFGAGYTGARSFAPLWGGSELVCFGNRPARVDDALIATLREREIAQQGTPTTLFAHGDSVRITEGAFAGLEAIYQMNDAEGRAMVLLDLLSKPVAMAIDAASLRKVGAMKRRNSPPRPSASLYVDGPRHMTLIRLGLRSKHVRNKRAPRDHDLE